MQNNHSHLAKNGVSEDKSNRNDFRYNIRRYLRKSPFLFMPFARWKWKIWHKKHGFESGSIPADNSTDILIEGFPRSGNTFASTAFKISQDKYVKVAHHLHSAGHVIYAVKNNIPCLVLVRRPEDAILSLLLYDGNITIKHALLDYISFYESIKSYRNGYVLANFDSVVSNFGKVVEIINAKFNKEFNIFVHSQENVKKVFEEIKTGSRNTYGTEEVSVVPTTKRKSEKEKIRSCYHQNQNYSLKKRADQLYNEIIDNMDI